MCGKTRVSCRVRIPKEDQEHGKSTSRSQLHIYPNCGLLLWSLASAVTQIKKLIRAKCTRLELDEAKTTAAEFRTLSVYLQRGNGRILINRDIQYSEEPLTDVINDM